MIQKILISVLMSVLMSLLSNVFGQTKKDKDPSKDGKDGFVLQNEFQDYVPISPVEYSQQVVIYDVAKKSKFDTLSLKELSSNKANVFKFLPNEAVHVTLQKFDTEHSSFSYGPASVTDKVGNYTVIMDYCKFTAINALNSDNKCGGITKVGIGLRITANIETLEPGVNAGSLFELGMAAQMGKLKGTISIDVIGIESHQITDLVPSPSEISPTSIQNTLQAIATIKAKIYDTDTYIYPQVLAVKKLEGDCSVYEILRNMNKPVEVAQRDQQRAQLLQQQLIHQQQLSQQQLSHQ